MPESCRCLMMTLAKFSKASTRCEKARERSGLETRGRRSLRIATVSVQSLFPSSYSSAKFSRRRREKSPRKQQAIRLSSVVLPVPFFPSRTLSPALNRSSVPGSTLR